MKINDTFYIIWNNSFPSIYFYITPKIRRDLEPTKTSLLLKLIFKNNYQKVSVPPILLTYFSLKNVFWMSGKIHMSSLI